MAGDLNGEGDPSREHSSFGNERRSVLYIRDDDQRTIETIIRPGDWLDRVSRGHQRRHSQRDTKTLRDSHDVNPSFLN